MSDDTKRFTENEAHKYFGIEFNQKTWELLGKSDRTAEEEARMISLAHASHLHWGFVGTPENKTRGEWMLSHVYAVLGIGHPALYWAKLAMETCSANNIVDFDLAYANEALARAHAANGDRAAANDYRSRARQAGDAITDAEAKQYFDSDFAAGPWFE
jgi:hypothetical protein